MYPLTNEEKAVLEKMEIGVYYEPEDLGVTGLFMFTLLYHETSTIEYDFFGDDEILMFSRSKNHANTRQEI